MLENHEQSHRTSQLHTQDFYIHGIYTLSRYTLIYEVENIVPLAAMLYFHFATPRIALSRLSLSPLSLGRMARCDMYPRD